MWFHLAILLPYALALEDDQRYCSARYRHLCQGKGEHVACEYSNPGPGPDCRNYSQVIFDRELRLFITHYINRRRQRVAAGFERVRGGARLPRPRIMMFVEWDRELASLAQRLADQCHFVHDNCRATVRYPYAGQTVGEVRLRRAGSVVAQRAVRRVLDAWWGERRRAEPKHLIEPFHVSSKGSVWGHFSQFAIWSLRAVGCGAARHGIARPRLLLVCDFSHTNMLGQGTIEPGPMAPCPGRTRRRPHSAYPLLCAAYHEDDTTEDSSDEYPYEDDDAVETTETLIEHTYRTRTTTTINDVSDTRTHRETTTAGSFYNKLAEKMRRKQNEKGSADERRFLSLHQFKDDKNRDGTGKTAEKDDSFEMVRTRRPEPKTRARTQADRKTSSDWLTRKYTKKKFAGIGEDADLSRSTWHRRPNMPVATEKRTRIPTTLSASNTMRQRGNWKQTRRRLQRPGEMALLHISTANVRPQVIQSKKTTSSLFLMDKDDVDQLFKDTGFHPAWRKS